MNNKILYKLISYDKERETIKIESCFGDELDIYLPNLMISNDTIMALETSKLHMPTSAIGLINAKITLYGDVVEDEDKIATNIFMECYRYNIKLKVTGRNTGRLLATSYGIQFIADSKSKNMIIPKSADDINTFIMPDGYLKEAFIHGNIKAIPKSYFSQANLVEIHLSDTIESIGSWAFANNYIENIRLPNNLRFVGAGAFMNSKKLSEIDFSNTKLATLDSDTFENCTNLKVVNLQSGIKTLNEKVFSGCENLEYIKLPNSIKTIYRFLPLYIRSKQLIIEAPKNINESLNKYIQSLNYYNKILIKYY